MALDRLTKIAVDDFVREYMLKNRPVVIADGMDSWKAMTRWTPEYFLEKFGDERVQVYGDLFTLFRIMTLREYIAKYFDKHESCDGGLNRPYVRWYSRLSSMSNVPWADNAFDALKSDWSMPYFLPTESYLLPPSPSPSSRRPMDANVDPFPAKGLFISSRGARTRLHKDPWASDAVLCQLHGEKTFVMYPPEQAPFLANGDEYVDVHKVNQVKFPDFGKAKPVVEDVLRTGEIVFIPAGWFHAFDTTRDSISLTWNFVHLSRWSAFYGYLKGGAPKGEMDTLDYFLQSPAKAAAAPDGMGTSGVSEPD